MPHQCGFVKDIIAKDIALERAIEGDLVPVIAGGRIHGYRRVRNDRLLMFAIRMNDRAPDGRRQGATQFQPRRGDAPASTVTVETLTASEAQDDAAARLAAFTTVDLSPLQQAELYDSLAAEARRRADLLPALDPDEPYLTPEHVDDAGLGPLASPHADDAEEPPRAPHERPWHRLHDEAGAQAIDDAVAEIEAAKLRPERVEGTARLIEAPAPSPSREKEGPAAQRWEDEGDRNEYTHDDYALDPTPLSPRTGKPLRAYTKSVLSEAEGRTPKPPFEDPFDYRNYKT